MKIIYSLFLLCLLTFTCIAQSGMYDVRFNLHSVDCNNSIMFVDIEIRATSATSTFNITDQNYRFSFTRDGIAGINPPITQPPNPNDRSFFIHQELCVAGFTQLNGLTSFYNAHTLSGSLDTVVSVNIGMGGGDGYPVAEMNNNPLPPTCTAPAGNDWPNGWVHITRLRIQLLGPGSCANLSWHTHAPIDFPNTSILEEFAGVNYPVEEGNYEDFSMCLADGCPLPIELISFNGYDRQCSIDLEWQTANEINNDYFIILSSTNGSEFKEIGRIEGAGTTSIGNSYSYKVENVSLINYFKLIQVDYDGNSKEFKTIVVNSE